MNTLPAINYEIPEETNRIFFILGYKFKYIPFILAKDIANVMSNWKLFGRPSGFIGGQVGFNKKYRDFLYSIPFDLYKETTPYYMAVEIIKDLSFKYDFRDIEKAIINQDDSFEFTESTNVKNLMIDYSELNPDVASTLKVNSIDDVSLNIVNLLKETEMFEKTFSNDSSLGTAKMTAYNQFKKIPKYKMILPTFEYNFALKNYNINQKSPNEIVIFRDISRSAETLERSFNSLILYFIKTYSGKKITIHEFTNRIKYTYKLNSIKDLQEYYNTPTNYYISGLQFLPKYIKEYSECYIISSGKNDTYPKMLNCIINGISKNKNSSLELLCNNTKGKYMTV